MGSAVDKANLKRELTRYHDAGMGGVHIIPIYGAKGWETNYIPYLSPKWMEMMGYSVREANRLGMGVDMTTGTGWCFGGPTITAKEANASVVVEKLNVPAGSALNEKFDPDMIQALMAFGPNDEKLNLLSKLNSGGSVEWKANGGPWRVYAISQKPSGQKVKRAAPGGEGWMLNPFYAPAMTNYLAWFDKAFADYHGPKPRSQYQDSYEYRSDWSPDFFAQFEKRRGYKLQDELPALFGGRDVSPPNVARVKSDYRETISDLMIEATMPLWVKWSHQHGFITRYEAHGAPGNLLDLYALADVPETEMFHLDRNKLVSKFASSAAHVAGRHLASSETGTWLKEHFTDTLADMKFLVDDMFLSGINHIFYHGTCYSPDEAGWPGWHFYASYEMNPRNSIWHDVSSLNEYVARCQSILQAGWPDNNILLYWPIYDAWSNPSGMVQQFTVSAKSWFEDMPIGDAARWLWNRGYQFDYVSDRQLAMFQVANGKLVGPGASYHAVVVPRCDFMPAKTLRNLVRLAESGATVVFQDQLPKDVPGLGHLQSRRAEFKKLLARANDLTSDGRILVGQLGTELNAAHVSRETLFDQPGLMCIRRTIDGNRAYFIANRGTNSVNGWVPLAGRAQSAVLMDPMTGKTGVTALRSRQSGGAEVYLQLAPGESAMVRLLQDENVKGPEWSYWKNAGSPVAVHGKWEIKFLKGEPVLPKPIETRQLASWTTLGGTNADRFAGTARYSLTFDAPEQTAGAWELNLGDVCQSARVRLNGRDLGTLITPPFRVEIGKLKRMNNVLEVDVTNTSANRIRDLDRRGVKWKTFHDINFVNINYRPFDASNWPLADSGLLGPVTLTPLQPLQPAG